MHIRPPAARRCKMRRTCGPHAAHIDARGAAACICATQALLLQAPAGIGKRLGCVLQQQAPLRVHHGCLGSGQAEAISIKGGHAAASSTAVQRGSKACVGDKSAGGSGALVRAVQRICRNWGRRERMFVRGRLSRGIQQQVMLGHFTQLPASHKGSPTSHLLSGTGACTSMPDTACCQKLGRPALLLLLMSGKLQDRPATAVRGGAAPCCTRAACTSCAAWLGVAAAPLCAASSWPPSQVASAATLRWSKMRVAGASTWYRSAMEFLQGQHAQSKSVCM